MDKKLRTKLEEELKELRQGNEMMHDITHSEENFEQLRVKLGNYEEKVQMKHNLVCRVKIIFNFADNQT